MQIEVYAKRAIELAQDARWREAIIINQKIISISPNNIDAHKRLGKAHFELDEFVESYSAYQKCIELDPGNKIAKKNLERLEGILNTIPNKPEPPINESTISSPLSVQEDKSPIFEINNRVSIKGTNKTGIITEILPNNQYRIFIRENEEPILSENDLEQIVTAFGFVTPQEFLRDLLIFKMKRPLSDTLYSFSMSRTNFEAYQFRPAIKFLSNPYSKILVADEVGLGKTIEACIIYLELKARMKGDLPRVLVVCPSGLRSKWKDELFARFGEDFSIMDSKEIRAFFNDYKSFGIATRLRGICSIEGLRREQLSEQITELGIEFDLVIIDEAHHMRNPDTLSFDLGEILSGHTDSLVMLTATPVHLQSDDLFYLLNILEPGEFENKEIFDYQLGPNKLLNQAIAELGATPVNIDSACECLDRCPQYIKENPYWEESKQLIQSLETLETLAQRQQLAMAVRNLSELNTFALVFSRTRRKDVQAGTVRTATVLNVPLSYQEQAIYAEALKFARARAKYMKRSVSILGLIQIERQLASSIGAFREIIKDFAEKRPYEAYIEESTTDLYGLNELPEEEVFMISQNLLSLYEDLGDTDSKFNIFYEELTKLLEAEPQAKVIVYSFFRKTLKYVYDRLTRENHKVEVIHGGVRVSERQNIIDRFEEEDDLHILLSSEVGAEGLDMQFCNTIINYDLPWNPMRVEQRIGRIDRYGQKSDKVRIVSLFMDGTIEERILQRLYTRIGVFEESIGALEPILGDIVRELSYDVISSDLTPEQETQKTESFLRMLENRKLEIEHFEQHRYELMGQDTSFTDQVKGNIESGRYVSSKEVRALVSSYLTQKFQRDMLREVDRTADNWILEINQDFVDELRVFLTSRENPAGREDYVFLRKLQNILHSGNRLWGTKLPRIPLTFNSNLALERRLLEFVNVWHPLARLSFYHLSRVTTSNLETRMLKINIEDTIADKAGAYYFFLFYLSSKAIVDTDEIIAAVLNSDGIIDESLSNDFLKIISEYLFEDTPTSQIDFDEDLYQKLKTKALEYMSELRKHKEDITRQRNDSLIAIRRDALEKTYEVKKRHAQSRLENATDTRIIRMHEGEMRNLDNKLFKLLSELEDKKTVSVSYEPIACGLMEL